MSPQLKPVSGEPKTAAREHRIFLLFLLFVGLYLTYRVVEPFFHPIVFAAVLSSFCAPLNRFLVRSFRGNRNLAAFCAVVVAGLVIVIPCLLFLSALVAEGVVTAERIQGWVNAGGPTDLVNHPFVVRAADWVRERLAIAPGLDLGQQLLSVSKTVGQALLNYGAGLLGNMVNLVTQFLIMFFVMFYLVRDGAEFIASLKDVSPLPEEQEDRILDRIESVSRSVLLGTLLTAVFQGIVGGIGLALVGIPGLFWGAIMGFTSLIPVVGTGLVWVPCAGYLAFTGHWKAALFLTAWCMVLVGLIDNVARPLLMRGAGGAGGLSPFFVFLSVMGGLQYFGLPGLLYGPLILGFAAVILYIYKEQYQSA